MHDTIIRNLSNTRGASIQKPDSTKPSLYQECVSKVLETLFLMLINPPYSESALVVQGLELELLFSDIRHPSYALGNTVCHRIYPLISRLVYSKSQSLLAAVLNHAAGLWGRRVPYEGSDTSATNRLLLPTYSVKNNKSLKRINISSAIWLVPRPEMGC